MLSTAPNGTRQCIRSTRVGPFQENHMRQQPQPARDLIPAKFVVAAVEGAPRQPLEGPLGE